MHDDECVDRNEDITYIRHALISVYLFTIVHLHNQHQSATTSANELPRQSVGNKMPVKPLFTPHCFYTLINCIMTHYVSLFEPLHYNATEHWTFKWAQWNVMGLLYTLSLTAALSFFMLSHQFRITMAKCAKRNKKSKGRNIFIIVSTLKC